MGEILPKLWWSKISQLHALHCWSTFPSMLWGSCTSSTSWQHGLWVGDFTQHPWDCTFSPETSTHGVLGNMAEDRSPRDTDDFDQHGTWVWNAVKEVQNEQAKFQWALSVLAHCFPKYEKSSTFAQAQLLSRKAARNRILKSERDDRDTQLHCLWFQNAHKLQQVIAQPSMTFACTFNKFNEVVWYTRQFSVRRRVSFFRKLPSRNNASVPIRRVKNRMIRNDKMGYYGYLVVSAVFIVYMFVAGFIHSFGVFVDQFDRAFCQPNDCLDVLGE